MNLSRSLWTSRHLCFLIYWRWISCLLFVLISSFSHVHKMSVLVFSLRGHISLQKFDVFSNSSNLVSSQLVWADTFVSRIFLRYFFNCHYIAQNNLMAILSAAYSHAVLLLLLLSLFCLTSRFNILISRKEQ